MNDSSHTHEWLKSYRVAKTHRMPYLYRSFSAKEPYNYWLFCGTWPATQGILWVFVNLYAGIDPVKYTSESCHTYKWVMSHVWMGHVIYKNQSCRIYEWVILHIWKGHFMYRNAFCRWCKFVVSRIWMGRVAYIIVSHTWMGCVKHMNESCHTYEWEWNTPSAMTV